MLLKILNSIFKILSWIVTIAIVVSCIVGFVFPNVLGYKSYIVQSGSMEPTIHTGSVAWINSRDKQVKVNDIVAYQLTNSTQVLHRIVGEEDGLFITKGDANETQDLSPVAPSEIIGKFMFSVPMLGYILADISSNSFKAIFIVSILLIILLINSFLEGKVKEKSERK